MDIDKIERAVSPHFDSYELFFLKEKAKKFESRDRKLYGVELKEEEGVAMRAIKNGRMVFAYTYEEEERVASSLLDSARTLLPFVEGDSDIEFPGTGTPLLSLHIYDGDGLKAGDEEKTAMLLEMEGLILDSDKRIAATRNCELQEIEVTATVLNSNGLRTEGRKTLYTLFGLAVAKEGDDEVSWYDYKWSHFLKEMDGRALGETIAGKAVSFLGGEQLTTGIYNGILTPQAACEVLSMLSESFLAESLFKDKTRLKDKVGERCFAELLTIIDSGSVGMGSFLFDGEGVSAEDTKVVEKGYFRSFLYDVYYGRKCGVPSTGNGIRGGLKEPPECAPRGLFIEKGAKDIVPDFRDGIIIEELMGTHTANPVTGDFSLGTTGYLVKGGERKPFQGVIFSGNLFEMLNSVAGVGNDLGFYGACGSPSLYVEGLKISGK